MIGTVREWMLSLKGIIAFSARTWILLIILLFAMPAFAQDPTRIYEDSTEALYNLDFSIAETGFERLVGEYPEDAHYWNALASTIWLKIIYDQQKLNIESFSAGSKFGTRDSRDNIDPEDEQRLRDTLATAIDKASAVLENNPDDIRALYALGNSHATLASFEGTAKRAYFAAHGKAKEAREYHIRVLELDPSFHDARLAVGTYDYVAGVVPRVLSWLLRPFGFSGGDKEGGIHQIEIAAERGSVARTDARLILTVIYNREEEYDLALGLFEELLARYPRNFLLELSKASIYRKMERWDDAVDVYENVLAKLYAKRNGYERLRPGKVYHDLGTANVERLRLDNALDAFTHVVQGQDSTEDEKASAHLWMGKIFDSLDERPKAVEQYNALLALDCDPEYKKEAKRYKRKPFES